MVTTEQIEVFDPYQYIHSEFLGSLDALTAEPAAIPVALLLSQHPEGLSLSQTQEWLQEATGRADTYSGDKVRGLGLHLGNSGIADLRLGGLGLSGAKLVLRPEAADLHMSVAVAVGSWQLENDVSWRNMLAKTIMFKYEAANASDAFGLLHLMTANESCTGGENVPDWGTYDLAMTRLVKVGVAKCVQIEEGINSYRLTEPHIGPATDLVDVLHDAVAFGMDVPRFAEFSDNELSADKLTDGMKYIIQKSMQNQKAPSKLKSVQ